MKVSIITEGFHKTGYGHLTRCLSIYQAFEERNIYPTLYINGDDASKFFLPNSRYEIIDWLNNPALLLNKISFSDIVIVDSYLADSEFYNKVSKITSVPVFIDDNLRIKYPSSIIINGSINAEQMKYEFKEGMTYLLGSRFIPLRKNFWRTAEREINSEIQSILITFGGQDLQNFTPLILELLAKNFPELKKKIVMGGGFKNIEQINKLKDNYTEIFLSPSGIEMLNIMHGSDIAIAAAGQTLYELACVGVPTIAIAVAENQLNNLSGWVKEGFLTTEINYQDKNLEEKLLLAIQKYKQKKLRTELTKIGREKVDGFGAVRIVQSLINHLVSANTGFYIRKATEKDSTNVFNLSNEKLVRTNSINQKPINRDEHEQWFTNKISDPNSLFLLAFNRNDDFIGQVRFDIKTNYAVVNISLENQFRGKGLSTPLLRKSSLRCLNERAEVNYILAYIKPANVSSIKGFRSAGYNFSHEEMINNETFLVYKLVRAL